MKSFSYSCKNQGKITIVHSVHISLMEESNEKNIFSSLNSNFSYISRFEQNNPWLFWIFFYSCFIVAAIIVTLFYVWVGYTALGFSDTDVNSARYLLSSILQAEAAIIAIVVSLTLIAMQLVATSYSPRVARIFSSGNQMYIILFFYVISIGYNAILLQMLQGERGPISASLHYLISFCLWFAIFLMIALVPYIRNILIRLQPETIISQECQRITKNTILSTSSQSNPLDLIFDILHQSVMRNDTGLLKEQLPRITERIINILQNPIIGPEIIEITQDFSQRLTICAQQSIQLDDMESTRIILENLKDLENCTILLHEDEASRQVIESIQLLELASANKKSWNNLTRITDLLEICGDNAIKKNLFNTSYRICACLKQATLDSIDFINPNEDFGPFFSLADRIIGIISDFAHLAISEKREATRDLLIMHLEDIWKYARNKNDLSFIDLVAEKILELWLFAVENKQEAVRLPVAAYNAYHAKKFEIEKYGNCSYSYEYKVMQIGISAHINNMPNSTDGAVQLLVDFRLLNVQEYNQAMSRYIDNCKNEEERAAYHHVNHLVRTYSKERSGG
jgi:hypothetical protein